jgi:2-polyprenyl-6-methoxyphenol hydroxylase-like FAD-dependent oxidoreductase
MIVVKIFSAAFHTSSTAPFKMAGSVPTGEPLRVIIVCNPFCPLSVTVNILTVRQIGGSIAGLMQGIMLKRLGHNVQILERSTSSERLEGGTGITLGSTGPESLEFFRRFDLVKKSFSVPSPGVQMINDQSKVTRYIKKSMQNSAWGCLHYNLRSNFDGYTSSIYPNPPDPLAGDGEANFSLGKRATGVKYTDGKVQVYYEDLIEGRQHSILADFVVVADGASSQIRQLLVPDIQRNYSGYLAWRGYVDESEVSEESRKILDPDVTSFPCKGGYILRCVLFCTDVCPLLTHLFINQLHHSWQGWSARTWSSPYQLGVVL